MWPMLLKIRMYTSYGKRKKPIYFHTMIGHSISKEFRYLDPCGHNMARIMQPNLLKLSMSTSCRKRKKPIYCEGHWTVINNLNSLGCLN